MYIRGIVVEISAMYSKVHERTISTDNVKKKEFEIKNDKEADKEKRMSFQKKKVERKKIRRH